MTMSHVDALLAEVANLPAECAVEVDLAGVTEVDTVTLSLLFEWLRQAHQRNCGITYANLPENLVSLATLYGVLELIPQSRH